MWRRDKLREHMPYINYFPGKVTREVDHYLKMRGLGRLSFCEKWFQLGTFTMGNEKSS